MTSSLDDPAKFQVIDSDRSRAYFCRNLPIRVDQALIAEMRVVSAALGGKNVRLCLHDGPDAPFHEMIILERREKYYRPHKHHEKGESFHLIEGEMGVLVFSDDGEIIDACRLDPVQVPVYRVPINTCHAVLPLTEVVLYHEAKPGPFLGIGDSVFPSWAPEDGDGDGARELVRRMLANLRANQGPSGQLLT